MGAIRYERRLNVVVAVAVLAVAGCANHSNDPKTCRERAAYRVVEVYPDPAVLNTALDTICRGQDPEDGP